MKRKKLLIIVGIITFLLLAFLILFFGFDKKVDNKVSDNKKEEKKEKETWIVPNGKNGKIYIYSNDDMVVGINDLEENYIKTDVNYKVIASYDCNSPECKAYGSYSNKNYIIIKDNDYYIYDYKKNKAMMLNLPRAYYNTVEFLGYEDKIYGISVSNINELYAYYSIENKKFVTEFKYNDINSYSNPIFANKKFVVSILEGEKYKYYVVDMNTGDELFESLDAIIPFGNEKSIYYAIPSSLSFYSNAKLYNESYKLINDNLYDLYGISKDGNVAVSNDNMFSLYNKTGQLIKQSKEYKQIGNIFNDYISVIDSDNYLKLIDYDGNIAARFLKIEEKYFFHPELSYIKYENGENIIYLCVENSNIEYGKKGNGLLYYYNLSTKEKKVIELESVY